MPRRVKTQSRNSKLGSSLINRFSRSSMYHRSGKWKIKQSKKPFPTHAPKTTKTEVKTKSFGKKSEPRKILPKRPRYYPTDIVSRPLPLNRNVHRPTRLRSSITPGTVLILLAGRFRGKRVVFLKQLKSGLLLVTGPYKINGVPLRRVNQAYVIATSTKIDVSGVQVDEKFNDDYFRRPKQEKKAKKTEKEFFASETKETKKKEIAKHRIEDQKAFDKPLLDIIKKTPFMKTYLNAKFSLSKNQAPHLLTF
jgi:large subunit ribosomal protein L6e